MQFRWAVGMVLLASACGDNLAVTPDASDASRCAPLPSPLPTEGQFADPLALPLSSSCVVGGLGDLPGRWFVRDPAGKFSFFYPELEGNCRTGFRRSNFVSIDDHDITDDGFTFHTWSDGTRFYYRYNFQFEPSPGERFEFAYAFAACLLPEGSMSAVEASYDSDLGARMTTMTGERFGRKDELAKGLALISELGRMGDGQPITAYNVTVAAGYAFVVGPSGFEIIDVTVPTSPVHVAHIDGEFNDVKIRNGLTKMIAYLSPIGNGKTAVVDVTNPTKPVVVGMLPEYSHSVFIDRTGTTAALYLATYTNDVPKYDLTVPESPVRLGSALLPGAEAGVHDLYVAGSRIYANNTTAGLVVIDVSAGLESPVKLGSTSSSYSHASWAGTAGGRSIVLHGDEGMTGTAEGGAFLRILEGDTASSSFLTDIGRYQSRPQVGIHNFQLVGDRAYIAYYQDGVRVVDLSDPTQPQEIAHYNTWDPETAYGGGFEGALGIHVANNLIYVADSERGLLVLGILP